MQEMLGMASVGLGNGSNVRGGRGRIQHASGFEFAAGELIGKHSRKKVRGFTGARGHISVPGIQPIAIFGHRVHQEIFRGFIMESRLLDFCPLFFF